MFHNYVIPDLFPFAHRWGTVSVKASSMLRISHSESSTTQVIALISSRPHRKSGLKSALWLVTVAFFLAPVPLYAGSGELNV
jgi:hypothetical protein